MHLLIDFIVVLVVGVLCFGLGVRRGIKIQKRRHNTAHPHLHPQRARHH